MEKMSSREFYEKYCKVLSEEEKEFPSIRNADRAYFDMVDQAAAEGKQLVTIKKRGFDYDGYMHSLTITTMRLMEGNSICLFAKNPIPFIRDLKLYFGIEVNVVPSKIKDVVQSNAFTITLKTEQING